MRRWQDPLVEVMYADGLLKAAAECLYTGGLSPEESFQSYIDMMSDNDLQELCRFVL
jgi:hypothetical protein